MHLPLSFIRRLRLLLREHREGIRLIADWRALHQTVEATPAAAQAVRRVVIVPSDPWTLTGSKGDEAMMCSAIAQLARQAGMTPAVGVVTATEQARKAATDLGFQPLDLWGDPWRLREVLAGLEAFRPDTLLILGADVMDGYYSPYTSLRLLTLADTAARRGMHSVLLGFSFNKQPASILRKVFDAASPQLQINLRDRVSYDRFSAFSRAHAKLVADMAFLLEPDTTAEPFPRISAWVDARRQRGERVIAFNLHPMLIAGASEQEICQLIDASHTALARLLSDLPVSVVLLSHDYRGKGGDDVCLKPLHAKLVQSFHDRLLYPTERMSAAQLKGVSGLLDGTVTGRMHLAIASAGMGVPVAALTYQDKFQGMFDHFGLPSHLLMSPRDAMDPIRLHAMLVRFLQDLPSLQQQVRQALPAVKAASALNLQGLR